ncbi:MAG TPA: hypothetical protein VK430_13160 [Xanthobacteraceae bacterium]|nr:hypothetical protein [Xanthobacteraceae bacterium]
MWFAYLERRGLVAVEDAAAQALFTASADALLPAQEEKSASAPAHATAFSGDGSTAG